MSNLHLNQNFPPALFLSCACRYKETIIVSEHCACWQWNL